MVKSMGKERNKALFLDAIIDVTKFQACRTYRVKQQFKFNLGKSQIEQHELIWVTSLNYLAYEKRYELKFIKDCRRIGGYWEEDEFFIKIYRFDLEALFELVEDTNMNDRYL